MNGTDRDLPSDDELDFSLLRLEVPAGIEPVASIPEPGASARGWVEIPSEGHLLNEAGRYSFSSIHRENPLKLAVDMEAIIGLNANATRVSYRTATLPGSGGAPCFNENWELVAIHHARPGKYQGVGIPAGPGWGQGIPIAAVARHLEKTGLLAELRGRS